MGGSGKALRELGINKEFTSRPSAQTRRRLKRAFSRLRGKSEGAPLWLATEACVTCALFLNTNTQETFLIYMLCKEGLSFRRWRTHKLGQPREEKPLKAFHNFSLMLSIISERIYHIIVHFNAQFVLMLR